MSNTKIVIDKDDFEQKIIGWIERRDYVTKSDILALFRDIITEIKIYQSIESRANEYAKSKSSSSVFQESHIKDFIEGATQQQIIEQLKVKKKYNKEKLFYATKKVKG